MLRVLFAEDLLLQCRLFFALFFLLFSLRFATCVQIGCLNPPVGAISRLVLRRWLVQIRSGVASPIDFVKSILDVCLELLVELVLLLGAVFIDLTEDFIGVLAQQL